MGKSPIGIRVLIFGALLTIVTTIPSAIGVSSMAAAFNQSSAPDSFGYRWIDNQGSDSPVNGGAGPDFTALWQDISTSGTAMSISNDEQATQFACPMIIRLYGENFGTPPQGSSIQVVGSDVGVSSNCFLRLLPSGGSMLSTPWTTTSLPAGSLSGAGIIALAWGDQMGGGGSTSQWQVVGTAPNRKLIVQWSNWGPCCGGPFNSTLQLQVGESDGFSDSEIVYLYQTSLSFNNTVVGIQSRSGSVGLQYSGTPSANYAIRFANNATPATPANLMQTGSSGGAARPVGFISDSTVYFRATVTDPDVSNTLGIQAEVLPSTSAFSSNPTGTIVQTADTALVGNGQVAEALLDFSALGLPSGDYHWRARTFDNAGAFSAWVVFNAAAVHFTTDLVAPTTPAGPFSPDSVQLVFDQPVGNVSFSWGPATDSGPPGPLGYRIQISTSDTFASVIYDSTVATREVTVNLPAAGPPYYWNVSAVDQAGNNSPPSATIPFQVGWTTTAGKEEDRFSNCGAGTSAGPWGVAAMLAALAIFAGARRRFRSPA